MKETLYDVALAISEAEPKYWKEKIPVVARVHGYFDGEERTYWFVVSSLNRSMYAMPHLKQYGIVVPRNSFIATTILNGEVGSEINYEHLNNIKKLVKHHIRTSSKSDLENHRIWIIGDKQVYNYVNINDFLHTLQNNREEIEERERIISEKTRQREELEKQENTAHERGIITKEINKIEEERRILTLQQEEMSQLTRFIRKQGQLRFNPILDHIQNRIKTKNLFNGRSILIDGGPGTGKTTTMIQRLKYLTDWNAIEEDFFNGTELYGLSVSQRDHLHNAINGHRDWMFFSPSELLKEYLSDAMNKEGLANTSAKVWHWAEYRNKVIRENYRFIDPSNDNAPFKASRNKETAIYVDCLKVISQFENFYLDQLRSIKSRFPKINVEGNKYLWISIAEGIKLRFEDTDNYSISQFIQLFYSLEQLYSSDCKELLAENRSKIKSIVDELYVLSQKDQTVYEKLVDIAQISSGEQNEDVDDEQDNTEQQEEIVENKVIPMIRDWFKKFCYSKKNSEVKLTAKQKNIGEILVPILSEEILAQMDRVGELALFEQYAKYTRGFVSNMLSGFATKYKRFRRMAYTNKDEAWNLGELEALLKRREGKELLGQEQALMIGFINNLIKQIKRITKEPFNHIFAAAYTELARPIIGIDEVTDFSVCDIYAMQSLLYDDYNSLTMSGDLMQRLTTTGLKEWNELDSIIPDVTPMKMVTSYRQSSRLLNVAKELFKDTMGYEPEYKAFMKSTKVPKPLAFISEDEYSKIDWIEKRLKEVYIAYGKKLPSIAIFLNNKNEIRDFVERLKDTDFIIDAGIDVVDGSAGNVLASSNQIRVYPIEVVKGMEFDVVFFHNIDKSTADKDLIRRYIYVGVSRAAFFLGITLNKDSEEITKYFSTDSDWSKI